MQHGIFQMHAMRDFIAFFLQEAEKQQEKTSGGEHSTELKESRRCAAVAARRALKKAKYLVLESRERVLTPHEWKQVEGLDTGKLVEEWAAKERAYGQGTGLRYPMTRHEAILFRVCCSQMDTY